ncbi:MAG: D-aminoacyl-tRNA deacylase [Nanoarchaeota archaeon]|nr:D-aminoacyl-tRNA deacylase [Nanoarchaeota archaeon]
MTYKKFLVVASKLDKAGVNITTNLSQFPAENFKFYLVDKEIIHEENLNIEKINQFDFIIFASKHKSEKKEKTLSVHAPGNWRVAELGGKNRQVCKTSALFEKFIFEKLNETAKKFDLKDYKITLECTHHGPLINKPCIFIEIGATEEEWRNKKAGFVVAKTISDTIKEFKENPYHEIAVGIGGPHYCPNFNKIQLNSNIAISHIIPQYSLPINDDMIMQAVEGTEEEIDFVLIDWKGLGNSERRQEVIDVLDRNHISYRKTSDINKNPENEDE